jgi:CDP-diglyceride synthetase
MKAKWQRRFWTLGGVSQVIILISVLALHFLGYMDFARTVLYVIVAISSIALSYFGYRMQRSRPEPGSKEEKSRMKIGYVVGGAWVGVVIMFFAPILLILLCRVLGGPDIAHMEGGGELWILMLVVGSVVGGIGGYRFGKRRGFQKPKWAVWLDEHLG